MDKNKIIEGAAKLVAKGAYDKAIKEYQKVLEADPKDVRILQKMGELYQKKNDNTQAAFYFTKVAESYSNDGFFLKAVALYKQVLKLDPSLVDVNLKLAELHQQLQLMSEAMAYYQIVANHYDKEGDTKKSLDTLRKMVDLDPENVASRIKLAELYARESMNAEALAEFHRAAEHLKRNNRTDDYVRVAERISTLEPNNLQLARELAEVYLGKGDQKRALAKLQICFKADSRDIETLRLLATAFQGLGQTSKTISVYKELAKVYTERSRNDDAEAVWQKVAELDPADAELVARRPAPVAASRPAPAAAPNARTQPAAAAAPAAPSRGAPPAGPAGGENLGKLLTETDVYVKYGLHDKALEHLRKVFSIDPENIDAHEKAYHIYVAANNQPQAAEQLLNVLRLHTRRGDSQRAQPYLQTILQQNPAHPEVPAFLSALRAGMAGRAEVEADVAEDAILVDSSEEEILVADAPDDLLSDSPADVLASDELALAAADDQVVSPDLVADEAMIEASSGGEYELDAPPIPDDQASVVDDEPFVNEHTGRIELQSEEIELQTGESEVPQYVADQYIADEEPVTQMTRLPAAARSTAMTAQQQAYVPPAAAYRPSDDETDFGSTSASDYQPVAEAPADQPFYDEAPVEEPISDFHPIEAVPTNPIAAAMVEEPLEAPPEDVSDVSEAPVEAPPEDVSEVSEEAVEAPPEEEPAGEECDEATFFVEQGLFEEAREILETVQIAYPGHRRAAELMAQIAAAEAGGGAAEATAPEGMPPADTHSNGESNGVTNGATEGKDAFDLATELANELGEMEEQPSSEPAEVPSEDFQYSVEEVFADFKKGLEKVVKPEDVETHYDLGIAYKEMGLMDDAIGEFVVARQGAIGTKKEVDCLSMMGALQMMKGDAAAAVESLLSALTSEHAGGDVEKALRYELGTAHEQAGSLGKALSQFLKVQALDGGYRDVDSMVTRLSAITVAEDDDPPQGPPPKRPNGSARKVGYL